LRERVLRQKINISSGERWFMIPIELDVIVVLYYGDIKESTITYNIFSRVFERLRAGL